MLGPCPGLALFGDGAAGGGGREAHAPSRAEAEGGRGPPPPISRVSGWAELPWREAGGLEGQS